jgi:hypothetical protein
MVIETDINTPGAAGVHEDKNGQPFALIAKSDSWSLTAARCSRCCRPLRQTGRRGQVTEARPGARRVSRRGLRPVRGPRVRLRSTTPSSQISETHAPGTPTHARVRTHLVAACTSRIEGANGAPAAGHETRRRVADCASPRRARRGLALLTRSGQRSTAGPRSHASTDRTARDPLVAYGQWTSALSPAGWRA